MLTTCWITSSESTSRLICVKGPRSATFPSSWRRSLRYFSPTGPGGSGFHGWRTLSLWSCSLAGARALFCNWMGFDCAEKRDAHQEGCRKRLVVQIILARLTALTTGLMERPYQESECKRGAVRLYETISQQCIESSQQLHSLGKYSLRHTIPMNPRDNSHPCHAILESTISGFPHSERRHNNPSKRGATLEDPSQSSSTVSTWCLSFARRGALVEVCTQGPFKVPLLLSTLFATVEVDHNHCQGDHADHSTHGDGNTNRSTRRGVLGVLRGVSG
eukprot:COSAG02_NODE_579_length_20073_cov_2118.572745_3_plen_275_part_00